MSYIDIKEYKNRPECIAEIGRAMVHPDYRNRGLMKLLLQEMVSLATEKGKSAKQEAPTQLDLGLDAFY